MTIPKFIEKAIEGKWTPKGMFPDDWYHNGKFDGARSSGHFLFSTRSTVRELTIEEIFLDPEAWKAVGKVEGWNKEVGEGNCNVCGEPMPEGETMFMFHGYSGGCPKPPITRREWKGEMHRMVDALAEGKTIEEYLDTL